jgi:hypothetical protein
LTPTLSLPCLYFFSETQVGTLHQEGNFSFFKSTIYSSDNLLSPATTVVGCIISWSDTCNSCSAGVLTGWRCQELKPHCSEKVKTACHIRIHGAQGLAMGVLTPIPLWLDLGGSDQWPWPIRRRRVSQSICSVSHARKKSKLGDQARSWSIRIGILIRLAMTIVTEQD